MAHEDQAILTAIDPATMRKVMGHFPTGVVVITAEHEGQVHGMTCQSFVSLSLEPPLISFSPARTSKSWPSIREASSFCINVLAADQEHISGAFARSGADKFAGISWKPGASGSPIIDGVHAWIECEPWAEYDGGDHTIVLGLVTDLDANPDPGPLVFHAGGYGIA